MNEFLSENDAATVDKILVNQLSVAREQLTPGAAIMGDLGADSLDIVEISMAVEEQFDLSIPDEQWDGVQTVADLRQAVARLLEAKSTPR